MRALLKSLVGLWFGLALAAGSLAAEVVGRVPFADEPWGQQSDASSPPPYSQSFDAAGGSLLEVIRWWGFHGPHSLGSDFDDFVVMLDGVVQSGALTVAHVSPFFDEYTLDVPDADLSASALSVVNNSPDVEWFWQSAAAVGNNHAPDTSAVAFSLIGRPAAATVEEPEMALLILAAVAAMALARQRRAGSRRCRPAPG
jgi:hypothetical protein